MPVSIDVLDLHDQRQHGDNMTPAAVAAVAAVRAAGGGTVRFPAGVHHFRAAGACERSYHIANNDAGPRAIVFPLIGCSDVTIDGGGSDFIFHGRLSPFVVEESERIVIRNLRIDYDRPFFTQGLISASGDGFVDLRIDRDAFPWRIEGDEFIPHAREWTADGDAPLLLIEFDPRTRAPQADGYWHLGRFARNTTPFPGGWQQAITKVIRAAPLPDGGIRLSAGFDRRYKPGNVLIMCHEARMNAGIAILGGSGIRIEAVDIFHAGGMGVIAQLAQDITCDRLAIRLRPGSPRLLSTNADATHFVNCTGRITLTGCTFENMDDDASNVHGICTQVTRLVDADTVEVSLMHAQQHGLNIYRPGDRIAVLDRTSLLTRHTAVVRSAQLIDPQRIRLECDGDIAGVIRLGDAIDNPGRMPEVLIQGCRTGNNRPRGFLISTPKRVVIEDNVFYNSQCGIHISGDANYWFESGAVQDVTIRRNRFAGCCYAESGYAITILPEIEHPDAAAGCFHRNITIADNDFELIGGGMLQARSVDGLTVVDNRCRPSAAHAPRPTTLPAVTCVACRNVVER